MRVFVASVGLLLCIFLFRIASGGLSLKRLNLVSMSFYFILFFQVIGGTIAYFGFRNHYTIQKIHNDYTIDKSYYCLLYAIIILPLTVIVVNRFMKIKNVMFTNKEVIEKPILIRYREKGYFEIICLLTIISIIASLYTFYNVGYIPLFKLLSGGGNHNFGVERINITRKFAGNQYIRNFLSLGLMPFLSLISYIYMRKSKNKKWLILFSIQFIFCILIKTYNFEKAPVIIYLFNFYIIEILMNTIKSIKKFLPYVLIGTILILFFYMRIFGYDGDLFSLSEGPISRIIISQVGTLCFHFDVFPNKVSFLHGASFPHWMGYLFGQSDWGQRSGAVVMEIYGGASVASGTAGVMSTTFIGEAYANWGLVGVIFSPIIFGSVFGLVQNFIYKQVKTPINMAFYTILLFSFTSLTVGGFIDIIYNVSIMFTVIIYVIIEFYARGFVEVVNRYGRKTKIRI